ncbi:MAG: gamma-glutamyl-gamma-aminobutyrate hydrolase family protein, partial [candidate division WOR-3 bacterium]
EIKYENVEVDEERDELEFNLIDEFLRSKKPIFGICRGFQVLTVFFGGSLYQDLEMEGFKAIHRGENGKDKEHKVVFSGVFEGVFGSEGVVNSNHHQGLKGFPERLKDGEILAVSEDHLVEAFISKKYKVLAVQWHPERHKSEISLKLLEIIKGELSSCDG